MINMIKQDSEERMSKAVANLKKEYAAIRTGKASAGLLDRITVDYYGTPTPIAQMAGISAPEPRMLVITPWDKTTLANIEKAILKSDLGITPNNDGSVIRLVFPQLNQDTRKELVKKAKKYAEDTKVAVRNIRRDANDDIKKMEKSKEITEDDSKAAQDDVQKMTDKYIVEIDKVASAKEAEIMEV